MEQIRQIEDNFNYHDNLIYLNGNQFWLLEHQITAFWHGFGISNGLYIDKEDYEIRKGEVYIKPAAMQKRLKDYIRWFVTSSQNKNNYSLFIKSVAGLLIVFGVDSATVNDGVGTITNMIEVFSALLLSANAFWGLVRKIVNSRWSAF